jgi:hypothetical protein
VVAVFPIRQAIPWGEYELHDVNRMVVNEAQERGLHSLDLTPDLRTIQNGLERPLFYDFVHPNVWGHRAVGVVLMKWLGEQRLVPGADLTFEGMVTGDDENARYARFLRNTEKN